LEPIKPAASIANNEVLHYIVNQAKIEQETAAVMYCLPDVVNIRAKGAEAVVSASKISASSVASVPMKPGTYKGKALSGLAPDAEPVPLVQQAQYEREIPRP
jgi:hypothetical protein